jgi:hypothetical protein
MGKGNRVRKSRIVPSTATASSDIAVVRLHRELHARGWVQETSTAEVSPEFIPLEPSWDYPPSLPNHRISEDEDEIMPTHINYHGMTDTVQVVLAGFDYDEACERHRIITTDIPGRGMSAVDAVLEQLDVIEKHTVVVAEAEACVEGDGGCDL